jgi:hypothetical protein
MINIKKLFFATVLAIALGISTTTITRALLQDTETSSGNTVKGGSINLRVGDQDPSTLAFTFNNVVPGEIHQLWTEVAKDGGIGGNFWMEISSSNSLELDNPEGETDILGEGDLDDCAEIQIMFDDDAGTEVLAIPFSSVSSLGSIDSVAGSQIDALVDAGARMNLQLRTDSCGNEAMGDAFDLDLIFHLDQV